jgi:UDP-N-acetylglucosamine diphosphorylase / glucose-1-phosphate thymidylyltransferase / UDP-N-acetylgalactosamine diphosphorylase / glucosamine-1-phosphate N-acetyltransferase / galactosamine-1-phosphate N-acetyltransferase
MSKTITKAVILAAGRGKRMRELTNDRPKPMVQVRGKPVVEYIIEGLKQAGIEKLLLIVGYRKEVVIDYFGNGSKFGVQIDYVEQLVQDGTGRVLELARAIEIKGKWSDVRDPEVLAELNADCG